LSVTINPRHAAFTTLLRIEKERSYADILIDRELTIGQLTGADRGFYTELVYGTLRKKGNLDHIIGQFASTPLAKLERAVIILLRLGLYQMFYLDRVPVSAAVNETVNLAKIEVPRAAGFINAVLRSADRGRDTIAYPDPEKDAAAYLSARYSHPRWLVEDWLGQLGFTEATALAAAFSAAPPFTIRANRLKTDRNTLQERLQSEGVTALPCRYAPDGLLLTSAVSLPRLASFSEGHFTVQDEASQLAAFFLAPAAGDAILDLCAAPGGKATYLAELAGDRAAITACDRNSRKLEQISSAAARLGITTIATMALDATKPLPPLQTPLFDRILVDAPCSGLGVIHRNPEGKWWKEPADPARLSVTQSAILANAAKRLKPGGTLLYSTCSTSVAENEQVVDNFLNDHPGFMIEPVSRILPAAAELETAEGFFRSWPHRHGMDGFFAARLINNLQE
jgi:16S rRNA (cytosine967-C5)-methyltransferase